MKGGKIGTTNTQIHDSSLCTGTLIKSVGLKLA